MDQQNPFKWRHYEADIILLCVRWYLRYSLSYRDLEEMMRERGLHVDHSTIFRWVQHYAPEIGKRSRPHLKACNDSWRVDETYIKIVRRINGRNGVQQKAVRTVVNVKRKVSHPLLQN